MGTRGCYGFRKNGVDKLTYNHFDSYPDYLGRAIVEFCKQTTIAEMNEIYDRIILVPELEKPTDEQAAELSKILGQGLSEPQKEEWYSALRMYQGDLHPYKKGLRYMADASEFIKGSLWCEYAYIINLDTNRLEFWRGFQRKPDPDNRYGTESDSGWYPCKMKVSFSMIPRYFDKRTVEDCVNKMRSAAKQK